MKRLAQATDQLLNGLRSRLTSLQREGARWLVVALGIGMIILGAVVPGTHSEAVAALVIVGAGLVVVGALLPRFKEAEITLKGFRLTQDAKPEASPWLIAEEKALSRVAELVLPDPSAARQVVEETVEAIQEYKDPIAGAKRATTTFRTLVSFLERTNERLWIDGFEPPATPANGIEALQLVEFPDRMAYVLRNQGLQDQEVSEILRRSPEEIEKARQEVRSKISPYVGKKGSDA